MAAELMAAELMAAELMAAELMAVEPDDSHALATFQAALLELLAQPLPPAAMLERLHRDPAFAPFQDYVAGFEPRMIEVAAALVKKWGRRTDDTPAIGRMPH